MLPQTIPKRRFHVAARNAIEYLMKIKEKWLKELDMVPSAEAPFPNAHRES
jgi:hypothetical protein